MAPKTALSKARGVSPAAGVGTGQSRLSVAGRGAVGMTAASRATGSSSSRGPHRAGSRKLAKASVRGREEAAVDKRTSAAATTLQAWYRGIRGRRQAARAKEQAEQLRQMEEEQRQWEAQRAAAAEAARQAKESAKRQAEEQREAQLRALRDRRCAVEQMCQGLTVHVMIWEEDPAELLELLPLSAAAAHERWLGKHSTRKTARKQYLMLARKWHPDKWALQGDACVSVATDVTKCLVAAYEKCMKDLPTDAASFVSCEDEDEEREVFEFASWVGVSFDGMFQVWKERKGVTAGRAR